MHDTKTELHLKAAQRLAQQQARLHGSTNPLIQGPPVRVVVNVGRWEVGGKLMDPGLPTSFDVYPNGTRVQVSPPPDPVGTRVVRQADGSYVKILPNGRRIQLGKFPYEIPSPPTAAATPQPPPSPTPAEEDALAKYQRSLSDEEYLKEYGHPRSWAQQPGETIEGWSKRYDTLYRIYLARVKAGWKDPFKGIK